MAREPRTDIELEILHEVKALRCEVAMLRQEVASMNADIDVIRVETHQIHEAVVPGVATRLVIPIGDVTDQPSPPPKTPMKRR